MFAASGRRQIAEMAIAKEANETRRSLVAFVRRGVARYGIIGFSRCWLCPSTKARIVTVNAIQIDRWNVENIFSHHPSKTGQDVADCEAIRAAALEFARAILRHCPNCNDRAAAIQKTREAMMMAEAAVALEGFV